MLVNSHERKHRRYSLKYPVHVKFGSGSRFSEVNAMSVNVSVGGMLLETASLIPEHTPVTFRMILEGGQLLRPIHLAGEGHVVRVQNTGAAPGFNIAVQCNKPVAEIDMFLASA